MYSKDSNQSVQGSYRQVFNKIQGLFKDFKRLFYSFQGLNVYERYCFKCKNPSSEMLD